MNHPAHSLLPILGNLKRGKLFILSAPAGTGKTTLVRLLVTEFPCVMASISLTTRQPRGNEVDGVDYYFVSDKEFVSRIAAGEFLEYVELYGHYYGTSRVWVEQQLDRGKHVVLVIDTQGARALRGKVDVVTIFVSPPSIDELEKRLKQRKTESGDVIDQRLAWAREEMRAQHEYDYLIVNDDLATAYQVLRSIFVAEEHRIG
ncbi:MAG: guanylate kinase [Parachlamydiaceae bacterium]